MVKVVVAIVLALAVFPWPWLGQTNAFAFTVNEGISPEDIYSLLKREYIVWGQEEGQWRVFDSKARPWAANTLKMVRLQQQYWIIYAESPTQSAQPAQAKLQLRKGWNLVPGSAFLWASIKDKVVNNLTEQRFPEFGLSADEMVNQAWPDLFGERFSVPVSVSSLDDQLFDRVRRELKIDLGDRGKNIFYRVGFRYDTNPPRLDRRTIMELSIYYRKESLSFLQAIHQAAHEKSHVFKEWQDWRYFGYGTEIKEAIADAGAAAVVRYLQEKRGMPEFSEPEERQELYGWARIIGTPEIRAEIATGQPSSASLAKFFRDLYQ